MNSRSDICVALVVAVFAMMGAAYLWQQTSGAASCCEASK